MRPLSLLIALLAAVALAGTTFAQDGTPGAAGGLPVTPDPAECTVEASTIDELLARFEATPVAGTPAFGDEGTLASPEAFTLPEGEPADEETTAQVVATLRELIACANSGNFLYIFVFITDDLAREFTAEPITEEEAEFFRATPPALDPAQYGTLVAVEQVTVLPDGRVGALFHSIFPGEEGGVQVDYVVLEEQADGRWLIDELVEDLEDQFPPAELATPAA